MTRSAALTALLLACVALPAVAQAQVVVPRLLPGTRGEVLTTIQGNALTSTNGQLSSAPVRLRDVRHGRVIENQVTDKTGAFVFKSIDPGSYIVEVLGTDRTVMAATQVLNVNSGQVISTVVKLPFRIPPFAGLVGNTTPSATAVTSEAAASGLLATTTAGDPLSPIK